MASITYQDFRGKKIGRLSPIEIDTEATISHSQIHWRCQCDCGGETSVNVFNLAKQSTLSCGCIHREQLTERNSKHGMAGSKIYTLWQAMLQRCYYEKHEYYHLYGGKGITVCNEWREDFQAFFDWSMSNGYEDGLSLDRIDGNDDYKPSNCRWVTAQAQANNTSRNHYIEYQGEKLTLAEAARKYNIPYHTLKARVNALHWPVELAITTPVTLSNNNLLKTRKVEN